MAVILLIDDDEFYRGVVERALTDAGYHVVTAQNAVEGIGSFQLRQPDLIITDLRMPNIGGVELIRAVRKLDAQVKIIAVSAETNFDDTELFKLAKDAGADTMLRKLDLMERILVEVNTLLGVTV